MTGAIIKTALGITLVLAICARLAFALLLRSKGENKHGDWQ